MPAGRSRRPRFPTSVEASQPAAAAATQRVEPPAVGLPPPLPAGAHRNLRLRSRRRVDGNLPLPMRGQVHGNLPPPVSGRVVVAGKAEAESPSNFAWEGRAGWFVEPALQPAGSCRNAHWFLVRAHRREARKSPCLLPNPARGKSPVRECQRGGLAPARGVQAATRDEACRWYWRLTSPPIRRAPVLLLHLRGRAGMAVVSRAACPSHRRSRVARHDPAPD
jgi:hypothetical protein